MKKTVNVTIEMAHPGCLRATCNICKCVIEYPFGWVKREVLLDVSNDHMHDSSK